MLSVRLNPCWEIIEHLCAKKYIPLYIIINLIAVRKNYIFSSICVINVGINLEFTSVVSPN